MDLTLITGTMEHPALMDVVLEAAGVEAQEMAEPVVRLEQEAVEEVQTPLMLMVVAAERAETAQLEFIRGR